MISEHQLHHMYQAWLQGQEDPERDWSYFVESAAHWCNTTGDEVIKVLQTTYWFKKPE
jgi:hypothetical protein